jgi:uncharacterized protein (TIGR00296 family)
MSKQTQFTIQDGARLIRFARENIEYYLKFQEEMTIPQDLNEKFNMPLGAFVTLSKRSHQKGSEQKDLRGCIGITQPVYTLIKTISHVSLCAAFEDWRFPPINMSELTDIVLEISILTTPELIPVKDPKDYLTNIQIGKDGLVIQKELNKALLLPQVPVENNRNWDVKTFLEHLSIKASLPSDAWKMPDVQIFKFHALIFEEEEPNGKIKMK